MTGEKAETVNPFCGIGTKTLASRYNFGSETLPTFSFSISCATFKALTPAGSLTVCISKSSREWRSVLGLGAAPLPSPPENGCVGRVESLLVRRLAKKPALHPAVPCPPEPTKGPQTVGG